MASYQGAEVSLLVLCGGKTPPSLDITRQLWVQSRTCHLRAVRAAVLTNGAGKLVHRIGAQYTNIDGQTAPVVRGGRLGRQTTDVENRALASGTQNPSNFTKTVDNRGPEGACVPVVA